MLRLALFCIKKYFNFVEISGKCRAMIAERERRVSSPGLKLSLSVSIFFHIKGKPARLSGAKEGRFTPPNEPPSGTGNQAIDEADDNYKVSLPREQLCEHQTSAENAHQGHTPA